MLKTLFKTMASVASKMDDDDFDVDLGRGIGEAAESTTRGSKKLFIYTFVEGIEVRAVCDGEKRGTQEEEPGIYYATASEIVSLVREKAEGLATGNSTNRDRFKTEILLANVTSVAKMSVGRIMREWTRQHPPKRTVRRVRLRGEEARKELRKQRRKRRRTLFQLSDNLPLAQMGPLSPRELAIVEHFRAMGAGGDQPNQLQENEVGDATDSNAADEYDSSSEEDDPEGPLDGDGDHDEVEESEDDEDPPAAGNGDVPQGGDGNEEDAANPPHPLAPDGGAEPGDPAGAEEGMNAEGGANNDEGLQPVAQPRPRNKRASRDGPREREEPVYREEVVMVPVEMTFDALAKEFVECFKHLEELSVKFHDDRLRQFPPFAYQHNPLARLFSIRANLNDLEAAHIAMLGSTSAGEQHTRNFFPASMVLSLYLKGFPDRFRDMVNSAVTVDPARYMHGWDDVLDRIEEMLGIWGKTSDVVYMGLLSQIKKGGAKPAASDSKNQGRKYRNNSTHDWGRFINSIKEEPSGKHEDAEEETDDAPVTKSELKSIIAAALAANPKSLLQQAKDQDKGHQKRGVRGGDFRGRRHQREYGYRDRGYDNGRRSPGGGAMPFEEKMKIATYWQGKMCKEGVPRDLKLCIGCHEWHFLHVPYGCPKEKIRERDPKAQPFNDFPATKEAQSILRVQDEEELRAYKQTNEGKTPREFYRSSNGRDHRNHQRRKDF